jgi:NADH dehydrogenase (ubiquinone) Fe-S protein 1
MAGIKLKYDNIYSLRDRMNDIAPHLTQYYVVENVSNPELGLTQLLNKTTRSTGAIFKSIIKDYYMTDSISRSSQTMAKCSATFTNNR